MSDKTPEDILNEAPTFRDLVDKIEVDALHIATTISFVQACTFDMHIFGKSVI